MAAAAESRLATLEERFAGSAAPSALAERVAALELALQHEQQATLRPCGNGGSSNVPHELSTALRHYGAATQLHPSSYKAWHSLAQVHFEVVQTATQELQARESGEGGDDGATF